MYNILIVEDHAPLARGVERYLSSHLDSPFINITSTGKDCLDLLKKNNYDIILLDINLPDIGGEELCRIIKSSHPDIRILALTGAIDRASVANMLRAGASGYVIKTSIADELIEAIESVLKGERYISRDIGK
jgi:DNA-binding NarL/FixJ family response regulator